MCRQSDSMRRVREAATGLSLVCLVGERGNVRLAPKGEVDFGGSPGPGQDTASGNGQSADE